MSMECPATQLFNHITRQCDTPSNVDCFSCPKDVKFIDVPVSNECRQFVRCFNNQTEQLTCADGLAFDISFKMCNWRTYVTCFFEVQCPKITQNPIFIRDRNNCAK